jgi:hypothetical protein
MSDVPRVTESRVCGGSRGSAECRSSHRKAAADVLNKMFQILYAPIDFQGGSSLPISRTTARKVTPLACTPRVERARGRHGYGSRGWVGHGRPRAVLLLATGSPWRAAWTKFPIVYLAEMEVAPG